EIPRVAGQARGGTAMKEVERHHAQRTRGVGGASGRRRRGGDHEGEGGGDAPYGDARRCEGSPTWMWAPVAAPLTAPRNAMNDRPARRSQSITARPSVVSGCTATSTALRWSKPSLSWTVVCPYALTGRGRPNVRLKKSCRLPTSDIA